MNDRLFTIYVFPIILSVKAFLAFETPRAGMIMEQVMLPNKALRDH